MTKIYKLLKLRNSIVWFFLNKHLFGTSYKRTDPFCTLCMAAVTAAVEQENHMLKGCRCRSFCRSFSLPSCLLSTVAV